MHIDPEEKGVKLSSDAESAVRDALSVKPNNALYSPYVRWPFPFGLWVYNHVEPKRIGALNIGSMSDLPRLRY